MYSESFGCRDIENQLPVTAETIFPVGSVTKAFTGALLGILASGNQVSLKDKPAKYVPDFTFYNDEMNNLITIEDVLSHRSGIGNQGTSERFFPDEDKLNVVQRLKYLKPQGEVKNSFEYSNMGYTLAGTIVEQITAKSWEANIRERLFEPLAMTNSYTTLQELERSSNYSLPYGVYNGETEQVQFEEFYSVSQAGALKSTAIDMSHWMLTWLNKGVFDGVQVIPSRYVSQATRIQNKKDGDYDKDSFLFGEGFGWRLKSNYGYFRIDHGGNTFGFSSNLVMFPFEGIGIIILTNQDNSLLPYMITDAITRRLLHIDAEPEYPVIVTEIFKPSAYKSMNTAKMPSQPLYSFCGIYQAKGFGKIEIVYEADKLFANLPEYKFQLEHLNYDSFFLNPTAAFKGNFNPQFTIQSITDTEGEISQLHLYSQKEPIAFYRE